ncbi:MAG: hypothetical protein STSR0003_15100 [Smithella sp.]|jgi:hypothetical protein
MTCGYDMSGGRPRSMSTILLMEDGIGVNYRLLNLFEMDKKFSVAGREMKNVVKGS